MCTACTKICVHVKDPISICRKRVGFTAGGMETNILHIEKKAKKAGSRQTMVAHFSQGMHVAWISCALHWDTKVIKYILKWKCRTEEKHRLVCVLFIGVMPKHHSHFRYDVKKDYKPLRVNERWVLLNISALIILLSFQSPTVKKLKSSELEQNTAGTWPTLKRSATYSSPRHGCSWHCMTVIPLAPKG